MGPQFEEESIESWRHSVGWLSRHFTRMCTMPGSPVSQTSSMLMACGLNCMESQARSNSGNSFKQDHQRQGTPVVWRRLLAIGQKILAFLPSSKTKIQLLARIGGEKVALSALTGRRATGCWENNIKAGFGDWGWTYNLSQITALFYWATTLCQYWRLRYGVASNTWQPNQTQK